MADAAIAKIRADRLPGQQRSRAAGDAFLSEMGLRGVARILDVTLDGAFPLRQGMPAGLVQNLAIGTIVNIGGLSGHTGAKNRAHVVTAKAGIVGLTRRWPMTSPTMASS